MTNIMGTPSEYGLENHQLTNVSMAYWSLSTPPLVERIISRREGILAHEGAVVVRTGQHTGRAPNDKFIVRRPEIADKIWWGDFNRPLEPEKFNDLYNHMLAYFQGRDVFIQDTTVIAHPRHKIPIRVITENAWHSLIARNLFIRSDQDTLNKFVPEYFLLHAPGFHAYPPRDGTNSEAFIVIDLIRKVILIGGTSYAGEIKISIFTILNFLMPLEGILPMHCAANIGADGDVAIFFGLSGTGKTALASVDGRAMIGDDEHGWGDDGIFNFEGGCYAKVINLKEKLEPLIWNATRHFGTILENVTIDSTTRRVDFNDNSLTENTRACYPIGFIHNGVVSGQASHPKNIFFLTADAFGILPPIARLTPEQTMYYFLSGYTSKLAGTEKGLGIEPSVTFSACFGAPFLPLRPIEYAQLLKEKIASKQIKVWLVNTGWTGGPYGIGERIPIPYTRAMIDAALKDQLDDLSGGFDPHFHLAIPSFCPNVPNEILQPRNTWVDPNAYDYQAKALIRRFQDNFSKYRHQVPGDITAAGPHS